MEYITLGQAVDIFEDSLEDILPVKQRSLRNKLKRLENIIDWRQERFSKKFVKSMDKHNIPLRNRELHLDVCNLFRPIYRDCLKLRKGLQKELRNIEFALNIGKGELLDTERARQYPIADIIRGEVKGHGKIRYTFCPFHKETHPSFKIYTDTNSFYCFSCKRGGDVISLVMELKGMSFRDAVKWLA